MSMLPALISAAVVYLGINNLMGRNQASIDKQITKKRNIPMFMEEADNEIFNPMNVGSRFEKYQPESNIEPDGPFGIERSERMSAEGSYWYDFGNVTDEY